MAWSGAACTPYFIPTLPAKPISAAMGIGPIAKRNWAEALAGVTLGFSSSFRKSFVHVFLKISLPKRRIDKVKVGGALAPPVAVATPPNTSVSLSFASAAHVVLLMVIEALALFAWMTIPFCPWTLKTPSHPNLKV